MTMKEFRRIRKVGDQPILKVTKHKTSDTHGPVNVVLTSSMYGWIRI